MLGLGVRVCVSICVCVLTILKSPNIDLLYLKSIEIDTYFGKINIASTDKKCAVLV